VQAVCVAVTERLSWSRTTSREYIYQDTRVCVPSEQVAYLVYAVVNAIFRCAGAVCSEECLSVVASWGSRWWLRYPAHVESLLPDERAFPLRDAGRENALGENVWWHVECVVQLWRAQRQAVKQSKTRLMAITSATFPCCSCSSTAACCKQVAACCFPGRADRLASFRALR